MKRVAPPSAMETARLHLRAPDPAMAATIFAAIDAERARLQPYLPWARDVRTVADEEAFIRSCAADRAAGARFAYAMFAKSDGAYVGNCGFVAMAWEHRYAEIGYWVRAAAEGRGLVTEAATCLEAAARAMGLHRLEIHCSTQNARSAGVPKRLGYTLEGVCREDFFSEGRYHDTAIYGKLLN